MEAGEVPGAGRAEGQHHREDGMRERTVEQRAYREVSLLWGEQDKGSSGEKRLEGWQLFLLLLGEGKGGSRERKGNRASKELYF